MIIKIDRFNTKTETVKLKNQSQRKILGILKHLAGVSRGRAPLRISLFILESVIRFLIRRICIFVTAPVILHSLVAAAQIKNPKKKRMNPDRSEKSTLPISLSPKTIGINRGSLSELTFSRRRISPAGERI